jgi:hypothetical protein
MPNWALTEAEYNKVGFPFDVPLDYYKEQNFEKNCKNPFTQEWYKEVKEIILSMKRVKYQGKEWLVTTRRKLSNNSEGEPQSCPLPDVEVWFKPNFKTKLEPSKEDPRHKITKVVGVGRPDTIYLLEYDPIKAKELYDNLADKDRCTFNIKFHGSQEIVVGVPSPELFFNYDFDYLYNRAWLNDPKFAGVAQRERMREAISLSKAGYDISAQNRTGAENQAGAGIMKQADTPIHRPMDITDEVAQIHDSNIKKTKK